MCSWRTGAWARWRTLRDVGRRGSGRVSSECAGYGQPAERGLAGRYRLRSLPPHPHTHTRPPTPTTHNSPWQRRSRT